MQRGFRVPQVTKLVIGQFQLRQISSISEKKLIIILMPIEGSI